MWPLPCTTALLSFSFSFFVFFKFGVFALSSLSVSCLDLKNRQRWGIYILANFSDGFLTRKHILQFLSILVLLRLFRLLLLSPAPSGLFADHSALSKSPPRPSIFLFSLHSGLKDFIWPHPGLHSDFYQMLLSWFNPCQRKKKEEKGFREEQIIITSA